MCGREQIERILEDLEDRIENRRVEFEDTIMPEFRDLGITYDQAKEFLLKLEPKDHFKTMPHRDDKGIDVHVFKPKRKLTGIPIYIKLFIDEDNYLIIQSFKEK